MSGTRASSRGADAGREAPGLLFETLGEQERLLLTLLKHASMRGAEEITRAYGDAGYDVPVVTRSPASRGFVELGKALVTQFSGRRLDDVSLAAIVMDGTPVGKETIVWALGVTMDGRKVPLGMAQDGGETIQVYARLLENLSERGLDTRDVLWVTDGGQAILSAVRRFAGERSARQRCLVHNTRNVIVDHLKVGGCVQIGAGLVQELDAASARGDPESARLSPERIGAQLLRRQGRSARGDPDKHPSSPRQVGEQLLAELREAREHGDKRAESACLRQIGETFVRGELYRGWAQPSRAAAAEELERIAGWLDGQGHPGAAKTLRDGMEGTLALHRLGVEDRKLRRLLSTTNAIESVHDAVSAWKDRVKVWPKGVTDMRQRFVAVAVAMAERSWGTVADRSRLEQLSLRILTARHAPDVELRTERDADTGAITLTGGRALAGGEQHAVAALEDLVRWVDRNDRALHVADGALAELLPAEQARRWLAREGFAAAAADDPAMVRLPARGGGRAAATGRDDRADLRSEPVPSSGEALSRVRDAVGGDLRLLAGVAETSLAMAPGTMERSSEELELEAVRLDAACEQIRSLEDDVQAWWRASWRAAAHELGLEQARLRHAGRGSEAAARPVGDLRRLVLGEQRAQWLMGVAAVRAQELGEASPEQLETAVRAGGSAFAGLDEAVKRVELAAGALAAVRALELERRIASAGDRVRGQDAARDAPAPAAAPGARAKSPIDRWRGALGARRARLLERCAEAMAPRLGRLDDATLLELAHEVGDPWSSLDPARARQTLAVEERDREALLRERDETLRARTRFQQRATGDGHRSVRDSAAAAADRAGETAARQWDSLRTLEERLASLRARDGGLDRFVAEHPEAALHHQIAVELARRGRERALAEPEAGESLTAAGLVEPEAAESLAAAGLDAPELVPERDLAEQGIGP